MSRKDAGKYFFQESSQEKILCAGFFVVIDFQKVSVGIIVDRKGSESVKISNAVRARCIGNIIFGKRIGFWKFCNMIEKIISLSATGKSHGHDDDS